MKNFNKALNYTFLLLKYRARSKYEITSRLRKKGYTPAIRGKVMVYLEENNYINDEKFTDLFISYSLDKGWGPIRIDFKLKALGIPLHLRKKALSGKIDYRDRVKDIIEEKLKYYKNKKLSITEAKIWQKITMHLARKGFDFKVINQEMENLGVRRFED